MLCIQMLIKVISVESYFPEVRAIRTTSTEIQKQVTVQCDKYDCNPYIVS